MRILIVFPGVVGGHRTALSPLQNALLSQLKSQGMEVVVRDHGETGWKSSPTDADLAISGNAVERDLAYSIEVEAQRQKVDVVLFDLRSHQPDFLRGDVLLQSVPPPIYPTELWRVWQVVGVASKRKLAIIHDRGEVRWVSSMQKPQVPHVIEEACVFTPKVLLPQLAEAI